jgi:hypothetical protein
VHGEERERGDGGENQRRAKRIEVADALEPDVGRRKYAARSYFFRIVTDAAALLDWSAAAVALTVTVDGDGTLVGAL